MIRRTQPKHCRCTCFSTVIMSKLTHFKPPSSNDVTKIKDTFYIEWQNKSCSLTWYISLWILQRFSLRILALKRPSSTRTLVREDDNSTGTIPAQYRGYCRNGTGPPLFYCHLRNSDLPFCTSAFYRSGTGKLLPYRYQPVQLHYIASIIYVVAWCWASTSPVQNLLWACHWPRTIQPVSG